MWVNDMPNRNNFHRKMVDKMKKLRAAEQAESLASSPAVRMEAETGVETEGPGCNDEPKLEWKEEPKRGPSGRFLPGNTGHRGNARIAQAREWLRGALADITPEALEVIRDAVVKDRDVKSALAVIDRVYPVSKATDDSMRHEIKLLKEQLAAALERAERRIAA